ncbi:MAG: hypothetical protein HUJ25_15690 [Crocinitomicaceae bacterium]|nr:hypothetical protein [Crocinitomicaceae bacterium]
MSISELFEHGERKQDKGHYRNLLLIANSDGELSSLEEHLLQDIGRDLGLTNEQLADIRNNPDKYPVTPPASRTERFEQMVNLIQMVQADGKVEPAEMKVLERVAIAIGYNDIEEVDVESVVALIVRGEDTEVIIEELL